MNIAVFLKVQIAPLMFSRGLINVSILVLVMSCMSFNMAIKIAPTPPAILGEPIDCKYRQQLKEAT